MTALIERAGAIAGAVSAIIALTIAVFIKPWRAYRRKQAELEKAELEFHAQVLARLDALTDDVGDLQYERLSQAHEYYTTRGWCTTSKKLLFCKMHESYTGKKRNHLSEHYEEDMLNLPELPDDIDERKDD